MPDAAAQLTIPAHDRDQATGPLSAPLVVVEYGDYECPHCGTAFPILGRLRAAFGAALTLVYRHFPLTSVHPHAQRAAETAAWAAQQGRFWAMHDYLYIHQAQLDDRGLLAAARALGLDPASLQHAWTSFAMIPRVKEDFLGGIQSGVTGTPKLFINGRRHDGAMTEAALTDALTSAQRL